MLHTHTHTRPPFVANMRNSTEYMNFVTDATSDVADAVAVAASTLHM